MGWYKEYLEDLADIERSENLASFFTGCWFACGIVGYFILFYGLDKWSKGEILISIGLFFLYIIWLLPTLLCGAKASGKGGGCAMIIVTLAVQIGLIVFSDNSSIKIKAHPPVITTPVNQNRDCSNGACSLTPEQLKAYPYLQGLENITVRDDLRKFYFSISAQFNQNQMGLKGTANQIKAGNKLMGNVYHYLGKTSIYGDFNKLDSIQNMIYNSNVSGNRKKKASEELDIGVETIKSFR